MSTHSATIRHYFEDRQAQRLAAAADIGRHLQSRYLYGKAFVLSDDPAQTSRQLERQWSRQTAALQQQRSASHDSNLIMELTLYITRMQHLTVVTATPEQQPGANVWINQQLPGHLPSSCRSLYLAALPAQTRRQLKQFVSKAPRNALVIDYTGQITPKLANWPLLPKEQLETAVLNAWHELTTYMARRGVDMASLQPNQADYYERFDDALDSLLDAGSQFLRHAYQFQETLQLAEPFGYRNRQQRDDFATVGLLTKRVGALTPSLFNRYVSGQDEASDFSLQDASRQQLPGSLLSTIARHYAAGRRRLADALERQAFGQAAL